MSGTHKWRFDFAAEAPTADSIVNPPGYLGSKDIALKTSKNTKASDVDNEMLKVKKAWDAALAPGKQLPMQAFMLWMSGNSVQIFSVAITAMLMFTPIRAIMSMNQVFDRYEIAVPAGAAAAAVSQSPMDSKLFLPKAAFVGMQFLSILLGMWKLNAMGLLPTSHSDWLAFLDPKTSLEYAA